MVTVAAKGAEYDQKLAQMLKPRASIVVAGHFEDYDITYVLRRKAKIVIGMLPSTYLSEFIEPLNLPFLGEFNIPARLENPACLDYVELRNAKVIAKVRWGGQVRPIYAARIRGTNIAALLLPDFTHTASCVRATAWLVQLLLTYVEDMVILNTAERTRPLPPPYAILNSILSKIEMPATLPKLKNAKCGDAVVSMEDNTLTINIQAIRTITKYTTRSNAYRIKASEYPVAELDITIKYMLEGSVFKPISITSATPKPVVYQGRRYCHENIRDYDDYDVCLGTYELPQIRVSEDVCAKAAEVARRVIEILSTPDIHSAFQSCIVTEIARDPHAFNAKIEPIRGEWVG